MANLAPGNVERQQQVLNAIKTAIDAFPKMGIIHKRERQFNSLEAFKSLFEFLDTEHDNTTLIRGGFIALRGPSPSDSGTVNRTPPEVSYGVSLIWQFEDERDDGSNSTDEFNDMMMGFYEYFEMNHSLGFRGLNIQEPELVTKHQIVDFFGIECHVVEFELTCSLYGN